MNGYLWNSPRTFHQTSNLRVFKRGICSFRVWTHVLKTDSEKILKLPDFLFCYKGECNLSFVFFSTLLATNPHSSEPSKLCRFQLFAATPFWSTFTWKHQRPRLPKTCILKYLFSITYAGHIVRTCTHWHFLGCFDQTQAVWAKSQQPRDVAILLVVEEECFCMGTILRKTAVAGKTFFSWQLNFWLILSLIFLHLNHLGPTECRIPPWLQDQNAVARGKFCFADEDQQCPTCSPHPRDALASLQLVGPPLHLAPHLLDLGGALAPRRRRLPLQSAQLLVRCAAFFTRVLRNPLDLVQLALSVHQSGFHCVELRRLVQTVL